MALWWLGGVARWLFVILWASVVPDEGKQALHGPQTVIESTLARLGITAEPATYAPAVQEAIGGAAGSGHRLATVQARKVC